MTPTYEEARREVEAALGPDNGLDVRLAKALRALLAGPPEPTEKQIVDAIFTGHPLGLGEQEWESARRVQALYRSRRNG